MAKRMFAYTTGPIAAGAVIGGAVTTVLNILADADFICQSITGIAIQAALPVRWAGLVQIDDSGVGRTFFSAATPFENVTGTGQLPFVLPDPRLVRRNSTLTITFTQAIAIATTVHLTLNGYKVIDGNETI